MANGKINLGKQSGGVLSISFPDGVSNTEVVLPESGTVATLSNIQGFKNLIINGRKQVNQSGLTVTDNAYNYDNHYKVGNNWFQFIEGKNILSGEPYTLSWEGVATANYYIGTAGATTINAQTFTPILNGETITPTITSNQLLWIKFDSDAGGSTYNKVQFESGTVSTPYEQRLYPCELNLVKRYVLPIVVYWSGYAVAAARAGSPVSFPTEMFTVPTLTNYTILIANGFPEGVPSQLGLTQNSVTLDLIANATVLDGRWSGSFIYVARP